MTTRPEIGPDLYLRDFERCARWLMELPDWPHRVFSSVPETLEALRELARKSPESATLTVDTAFLLGYLRALPDLAATLAEMGIAPSSLPQALQKTAFALAHISFPLALSTIRKARAKGANPVDLLLREVAHITPRPRRSRRAPRRIGPDTETGGAGWEPKQ
jgi:hypothetical protein